MLWNAKQTTKLRHWKLNINKTHEANQRGGRDRGGFSAVSTGNISFLWKQGEISTYYWSKNDKLSAKILVFSLLMTNDASRLFSSFHELRKLRKTIHGHWAVKKRLALAIIFHWLKTWTLCPSITFSFVEKCRNLDNKLLETKKKKL